MTIYKLELYVEMPRDTEEAMRSGARTLDRMELAEQFRPGLQWLTQRAEVVLYHAELIQEPSSAADRFPNPLVTGAFWVLPGEVVIGTRHETGTFPPEVRVNATLAGPRWTRQAIGNPTYSSGAYLSNWLYCNARYPLGTGFTWGCP